MPIDDAIQSKVNHGPVKHAKHVHDKAPPPKDDSMSSSGSESDGYDMDMSNDKSSEDSDYDDDSESSSSGYSDSFVPMMGMTGGDFYQRPMIHDVECMGFQECNPDAVDRAFG